MPELILHHYDISAFSERVRLAMGLKGLVYRSVLIPPLMPKPDLTALTGGYRRAPVLQIGADIFCDSLLILRTLEKRHPEPSLFPDGSEGVATALAWWADKSLFMSALGVVRTVNAGRIPPDFVAERKAFGFNLDPDDIGPLLPLQRDRAAAHIGWLEAMPSSRAPPSMKSNTSFGRRRRAAVRRSSMVRLLRRARTGIARAISERRPQRASPVCDPRRDGAHGAVRDFLTHGHSPSVRSRSDPSGSPPRTGSGRCAAIGDGPPTCAPRRGVSNGDLVSALFFAYLLDQPSASPLRGRSAKLSEPGGRHRRSRRGSSRLSTIGSRREREDCDCNPERAHLKRGCALYWQLKGDGTAGVRTEGASHKSGDEA